MGKHKPDCGVKNPEVCKCTCGQPTPAPLPEFASFVALADKAADNAFEVIAQLRALISYLTRRVAEAEGKANANCAAWVEATDRAEAAEARATTAEQEACEALAGAHAEQEVSRHWKEEAEGLKSIIDAAGNLHRNIAKALGNRELATECLVANVAEVTARVRELEAELEWRREEANQYTEALAASKERNVELLKRLTRLRADNAATLAATEAK